MLDFRYYTPTKVLFGKHTEEQVSSCIEEFGGKKVLIHFGGGSCIRSGLMKKVTDSLNNADISYITFGGVKPNPRLSLVYEGFELCVNEKVDFILAVGGESVVNLVI
ncbi:MAG: iron-containing alcohol dehydrogenase [Bacillota bacterium]|nr:iron-containing alcohol dehydrogenase [Bacillota bacterium]